MTVNTNTHITKTLTQMSKHPHITKPTHTHTHTLQNPYTHIPTHYKSPHTHTLQNKLQQTQYKVHPNEIVTIKYPQCKVTLINKALLFPRTSP